MLWWKLFTVTNLAHKLTALPKLNSLKITKRDHYLTTCNVQPLTLGMHRKQSKGSAFDATKPDAGQQICQLEKAEP